MQEASIEVEEAEAPATNALRPDLGDIARIRRPRLAYIQIVGPEQNARTTLPDKPQAVVTQPPRRQYRSHKPREEKIPLVAIALGTKLLQFLQNPITAGYLELIYEVCLKATRSLQARRGIRTDKALIHLLSVYCDWPDRLIILALQRAGWKHEKIWHAVHQEEWDGRRIMRAFCPISTELVVHNFPDEGWAKGLIGNLRHQGFSTESIYATLLASNLVTVKDILQAELSMPWQPSQEIASALCLIGVPFPMIIKLAEALPQRKAVLAFKRYMLESPALTVHTVMDGLIK